MGRYAAIARRIGFQDASIINSGTFAEGVLPHIYLDFIMFGTTGGTADKVIETGIGGSWTPYFRITAGGELQWLNPATGVCDVNFYRSAAGIVACNYSVAIQNYLYLGVDCNLYRSAANKLKTDDDFVLADGKKLEWSDVNLYRSAANVLMTDDDFRIADGKKLVWSDVNLYRYAADVLATDDNFLMADGRKILWSDVNLYRLNANILKTDDNFAVGDTTNYNIFIDASQQVIWFGDRSSVWDTNIYRFAANHLKTDDDFEIAGNLKGRLRFEPTLYTIDTGQIIVITNHAEIRAEGYPTTKIDNLDNIGGGQNGWLVYLHNDDDAGTITVRDNTVGGGNIYLTGAGTFPLDDAFDCLILFCNCAGNWIEVARHTSHL